MTAPATERPALTAVPDPRPAIEPVPLAAARLAWTEALNALGVTTDPKWTVSDNAVLTLLLQASGAAVNVPQDIAVRAALLGTAANYHPVEAAS